MSAGAARIPAPWRGLVERLVAEYRAALGDDLLAIACFGSVARGQAGPESDLDLYVVTRGPASVLGDSRLDRVRRTREGPEYQALTRAGYHPDLGPVYHTTAELAAHPWILLDIAHHGIVLYDPEGVLARELEAIRCRLRELGSQRIELPDGTWYWDLKPDWRPGEVFDL
ncbi:MAG: nucleotidyltransferase domain-containing protein [Dehalococcoidia bacterium]|nr:nucleotidyltransferase domain-containing protein [Dehalococcoidia bacterium]